MIFFLLSEKSIRFGDKKVNKTNFFKDKKLFIIDDIDVDKIFTSKKEYYVNRKKVI